MGRARKDPPTKELPKRTSVLGGPRDRVRTTSAYWGMRALATTPTVSILPDFPCAALVNLKSCAGTGLGAALALAAFALAAALGLCLSLLSFFSVLFFFFFLCFFLSVSSPLLLDEEEEALFRICRFGLTPNSLLASLFRIVSFVTSFTRN